jgi:hypothetical protein
MPINGSTQHSARTHPALKTKAKIALLGFDQSEQYPGWVLTDVRQTDRFPGEALSNQRTVVPRAFTFPVPENVNDETAAALANPGVSAWLSLAYRAKLVRGENVLILGATG